MKKQKHTNTAMKLIAAGLSNSQGGTYKIEWGGAMKSMGGGAMKLIWREAIKLRWGDQ